MKPRRRGRPRAGNLQRGRSGKPAHTEWLALSPTDRAALQQLVERAEHLTSFVRCSILEVGRSRGPALR